MEEHIKTLRILIWCLVFCASICEINCKMDEIKISDDSLLLKLSQIIENLISEKNKHPHYNDVALLTIKNDDKKIYHDLATKILFENSKNPKNIFTQISGEMFYETPSLDVKFGLVIVFISDMLLVSFS